MGSRRGRYRSVMSEKMRHSATAEGVTGVGDRGPFCKHQQPTPQHRTSSSSSTRPIDGVSRGVCIARRKTRGQGLIVSQLRGIGRHACWMARLEGEKGTGRVSRVCHRYCRIDIMRGDLYEPTNRTARNSKHMGTATVLYPVAVVLSL